MRDGRGYAAALLFLGALLLRLFFPLWAQAWKEPMVGLLERDGVFQRTEETGGWTE